MFFSDSQINVQHPAAKSMLEVARTQDEETGDGTTSVIILGMTIVCTIEQNGDVRIKVEGTEFDTVCFKMSRIMRKQDLCLGENKGADLRR